jgi:HSP90 family molecular chaperone
MEEAENIDIIGQFGVGFYSAFMVAESVTVITRKYGEDAAWKWVSDGADGYTPVRGTDYWTAADRAEIKAYVDEAILGGAW